MWLEAIFSQDDLTEVLAELFPLEILLGEEGRTLTLLDPSNITLVADQGVRVACKAKVRWPVLGVGVPIALNALSVLLRPSIVKNDADDHLVFHVEIEHADLALVPAVLDEKITDKVNKVLAEKHVELVWDFTETLTHSFKLPPMLATADSFDLSVKWGKVKVTGEALGLVVSFEARVTRSPSKATDG